MARKRPVKIFLNCILRNVYEYIKSFLSGRKIVTKAGHSLSSAKNIDTGIPHGSILVPVWFTIMIHDLPKPMPHTTDIVQYMDDIAVWMNTSLRKRTLRRFVNYVGTLYQSEIDKLVWWDKLIWFFLNNSSEPKELPQFKLNSQDLLL